MLTSLDHLPHVQKAMSSAQVRESESIVRDVILANKLVYAKEAPLPLAKEVQGLRAVFDEVGVTIFGGVGLALPGSRVELFQ